MKRLLTLWLLTVCAALTWAQGPVAKPPIITDAQRAAYFKAQSEYQAAAMAAEHAANDREYRQKALRDAMEEITKVCGKDYTPTMTPAGDPACVAKPVVKETK